MADDAVKALRAELANLPEDQLGRGWLLSCDDNVLQRFQTQYASHAKAKLIETAKWRASYGADALVRTWPADDSWSAKLVRSYWPGAVTGKDHEGRPVHVNRFGVIDFASLLKLMPVDVLVRHSVWMLEEAIELDARGINVQIFDMGGDEAGDNLPKAEFTIVDAATYSEAANHVHTGTSPGGSSSRQIGGAEGAGQMTSRVHSDGAVAARHLFSRQTHATVKFLRAMAAVVDPHYPQMNATVYVVRAPRVFSAIWSLVSSFMPRGVEKKLKIYHGLPLEELSRAISLEALPPCLGGTSSVVFPLGGNMCVTSEVVSSEYRDVSEL